MSDNKLYEITANNGTEFNITMLADHCVYQGHFPGNPITPGVMTLKMIRECVETLVKKPLRYTSIKNCRYVALVRPNDKLLLSATTEDNNGAIVLKATLAGESDPEDIRLQIDAELQ